MTCFQRLTAILFKIYHRLANSTLRFTVKHKQVYFETMTTTVYYAKWILLPGGVILTNGALVVCGNTISAVNHRSQIKRTSKDRVINLGKRILLPGCINIHTHLEEGAMRGINDPGESGGFTQWLLKKESFLKNTRTEEMESSIRLGIRESLANGITTIADTSRTGVSAAILAQEPVRSFVFNEISRHDDQLGFVMLSELFKKPLSKNSAGAGPYSLFSLTPAEHKTLINYTRLNNLLWASHLAESAEELQAFSEQAGDLYFYITRKVSWPYSKTERGSMYYALTNNCIPHGGILYHCNYAGTDELSLIAAKNVSVVICGQYNDLCGHKQLPVELALKRGINICCGTEMPVSTYSMNLFDELYLYKKRYPDIAASVLLDLITRNPARALGCANTLGSLEPGKFADIIGFTLAQEPHNAGDVLEEFFQNNPPIDFVVVNGEEIIMGT